MSNKFEPHRPAGISLVLIKNYLPDGLWAYAFISCILIIWDRRINFTWVLITTLIAAAYEWLQSQHIFNGTGDIFDVLAYITFGTTALIINKQFYLKFNSKSGQL